MASKEGALASAWKAGAQQSLGASSGKGEEKASGLSAVSEPLPPAPPSEGTTTSGLPGPFPWPKAPSYPLRSPIAHTSTLHLVLLHWPVVPLPVARRDVVTYCADCDPHGPGAEDKG